MAIQNFKFVSPGVKVQEIDNSKLPRLPEAIGPVIIGRSERGPGLRPMRFESYSEFVEVCGVPNAGAAGGDVWRQGPHVQAPTYGAYAAQAYLRNNSPITFVRLLGASNVDATATSEANGAAGWDVGDGPSTGRDGGAYGLFLVDSGSAYSAAGTPALTGCLAAVFYLNEGEIFLEGTPRVDTGSANTTALSTLIYSDGVDNNFTAVIRNAASVNADIIKFNFSRTSKNYIRKVFNTNPTRLNSAVTSDTKTYFLGETFDSQVDKYISGSTAGSQFGFIAALAQGSTARWNDNLRSATRAKTPWIIGQHLGSRETFRPEDAQNLFQIRSLDSGEWESKNLKVSITDVKASTNQEDPFGTFTVLIRSSRDTDNAVRILEAFPGCNLNPNSEQYVAKVIGDKYVEWDDREKRFREYGDNPNRSRFVYVHMNTDVARGNTEATYLPFGFKGPVSFNDFRVLSGSSQVLTDPRSDLGVATTDRFIKAGESNITGSDVVFPGGNAINVGPTAAGAGLNFLATYKMPSIRLRTSSSVGSLSSPKDAFFGLTTDREGTTRFDESYQDLVRALPDDYDAAPDSLDADGVLKFSHIFTLDDIIPDGSANAAWESGSLVDNRSFNAISSSWNEVLKRGFNKFTVPMVGGFDGVRVTELDPFNNRVISGKSETTHYAMNSIKRAIDTVADPEVVETNIITVPGITNTVITDKVIKTCEDRADCLGIIDVEGGYTPPADRASPGLDSDFANRGNVSTTVDNLEARAINSSYAAAYYPWVQVRDTETGKNIWVPPSIPALGVLGKTEATSELWFAPAGFTRGGLTEGAAGISVVGVREKLREQDRDDLYAANINPIGTFPAEGIVILGQKTLQVTPSALDRVNVRLLMNHVKKVVSRIASRLLFDQNVRTTWDRFTGQVVPELDSIKTRLGLQDFRVLLDESTTTPDLVDRNTLYAKIFLKPARAIEFIAIDFVVTRSGASFED